MVGGLADFAHLKREEKIELARIAAELKKRQERITIRNYRPYAKQLAFHKAGATHAERLFLAGNQLGKAQPIDEPVLTPTGWRAIGDLAVGDAVIAGDGSVCQVSGVFPQGQKPVFSVEFSDGAATRCCDEHLWATRLTKAERFRSCGAVGTWTVRSLAEIRAHGGDEPVPRKRAVIPVVGAVALAPQPVPLDPYLLGVLLGDGCLRHERVTFSSADAEVVEAVRAAMPAGVYLKQLDRISWAITATGRGPTGGWCNPVTQILRGLGVAEKLAHEKRVPPAYLWNSPDVRLAVLQGLMDTDGSANEAGGVVEFCTTSPWLAEGVAFLVRSFGGKVRTVTRRTTYTHKGEKRVGRLSYRMAIRCKAVPLFRLARKQSRVVRATHRGRGGYGCEERVLYRVRPAGEAECVCIAVTHPSRTYVTRDFIVTHNTIAGGVEVGFHLTGRYPDWWCGLRFDRPIAMWAGSDTGENTRDRNQRVTLGRVGEIGTGAIPGECIDYPSIAMRRGTANAVDGLRIKHVSGGSSLLAFKSYDQGRQSWQGETLDFVWFDEEPPEDIYSEGLTRTNTTGGHAMITATPLLGMTNVIGHFYPKPDTPQRHVVQMTIDDAGHYTAEQRAEVIAKYPAHERDARARGIPMLGSGRIFPVAEEVLKVEPFDVPHWWPQIGGIDFGWTHPTAAIRLAFDRDADIAYVVNAYRRVEAEPLVHAAALKPWGEVPWAWPHDGENKTAAGAGEQLSKQYARHGLKMLADRATFEDDRKASVEAGLMYMLERMQTGRLKVFSHLGDWWEEFRQYHRKDGRVVKERDDLMDATRYALMMQRFARVVKPKRNYLRGLRPLARAGFMAG